jgi:hypothetical protein
MVLSRETEGKGNHNKDVKNAHREVSRDVTRRRTLSQGKEIGQKENEGRGIKEILREEDEGES